MNRCLSRGEEDSWEHGQHKVNRPHPWTLPFASAWRRLARGPRRAAGEHWDKWSVLPRKKEGSDRLHSLQKHRPGSSPVVDHGNLEGSDCEIPDPPSAFQQ